MTEFADLLKAKDAATEAKKASAHEASVAADRVVEAETAMDKADKTDQAAEVARLEAHKAIHDRLSELGDHYLTDDNGTLTVFRAVDHDPGWVAQQPIPGTGVKVKAK